MRQFLWIILAGMFLNSVACKQRSESSSVLDRGDLHKPLEWDNAFGDRPDTADMTHVGRKFFAKLDCSLASDYPKMIPMPEVKPGNCLAKIEFFGENDFSYQIGNDPPTNGKYFLADSGFSVNTYVYFPSLWPKIHLIGFEYVYDTEDHPRRWAVTLTHDSSKWPVFQTEWSEAIVPISDQIRSDLKSQNTISAPPTSPGSRLAMLETLEAMDQIRNTWGLVYDLKQPKNGLTVKSTDDDGKVAIERPETCLSNNIAAVWSDITMHYYCQLMYRARSCFSAKITGAAREDIANASPEKKLSPPQAYDDCKDEKYFGWIHKNQERVFKYLMFTKADAFDSEDQQKVINAFYRINDPKNKDECSRKRPRRYIDPIDGTHCLPTKVTKNYPNGWHR
jgi:hypothetical protein